MRNRAYLFALCGLISAMGQANPAPTRGNKFAIGNKYTHTFGEAFIDGHFYVFVGKSPKSGESGFRQ